MALIGVTNDLATAAECKTTNILEATKLNANSHPRTPRWIYFTELKPLGSRKVPSALLLLKVLGLQSIPAILGFCDSQAP